MDLSADSTTLVTSSSDLTARLWSMPSGELRQTLKGHKVALRNVAISPDGSTIYSGAWTVRLRSGMLRQVRASKRCAWKIFMQI